MASAHSAAPPAAAVVPAPPVNAASATPAKGTLTVTAEQQRALGLRTEPVAAAAGGGDGALDHPALVTVPPAQQRVVAAPVAGWVEQLPVQVGDVVKPGQVLAVLRSREAHDLRHELLAATAQSEQARATAVRDEKLHAEGLIAKARLEASRAQAKLAALALEDRRHALELAQRHATIQDGVVTLTSPMHGVVLERVAALGQRAEAAGALLRIANLARVWVEVQVPVAHARGVRVGDGVAVAPEDGQSPTRLGGRVLTVGRAVDAASQTVLVRAEVTDPAGRLRIGQGVRAGLASAGGAVGGPSVPNGAVVQTAAGPTVFVQTGAAAFEARPVRVLRSGRERAEVDGLAADARVVVQGTAALKALVK